MEVRILNYGGIITHIYTPDKNGKQEDITLGFDDFEGTANNIFLYRLLITWQALRDYFLSGVRPSHYFCVRSSVTLFVTL